MRPIFSSTACLAKHFASLGHLVHAMEEAGIYHIELGHCPPLKDLRVPEDLRGLKSCAFLVHNYFPPPIDPFVLNLASADEAVLRRSREFCAKAIGLCAELGAPFYSVHCGFLAEFQTASLGKPLVYGPITPYEDGYRIFTESLQELLSVGARLGLRLLIEPNVVAPYNLVGNRNRLLMLAEPHEFSRLLADFKGTGLGVLLDLGHLKVSARTLGFEVREFVSVATPAVGAFHIHDNDGTADQHRPLSGDSWEIEILRRPEFDGVPVVNEAQFADIDSLAAYICWLDRQLNGPLISVP